MLRPAEPFSRRLAWALFATAITLFMLLSAPALLALGIPYDAPYGPIVAKLHPGTYVLALAWFAALASHGNPLGVLIRQFRAEPLVGLYLGCMVVVFGWVIYRHGSSGAAYIIQTLWMPAVAVLTLRLLGTPRRRQIVWLIMGLLVCNAAIAIVESLVKVRLVPIPAEQIGYEYFRASALLGGPLLNANVTIALLPAVTLLPLAWPLRAAFAVLLFVSVLAFGARAALVFGVLLYGGTLVVATLRRVLQGRYTYLQLTGGSLALLACAALAIGVVSASGLGERIFQNLAWDNSASVRTRVWDAFDYLRGSDWWFGIPPAGIDRIAVEMGLDPRFEAIENFWIYAFLQFGAIGFVPFMVGLGGFTVHLLRVATPAMRLGILMFYLVASTANALSSKTVSFTLLATVAAASAATRARPVPRARAGATGAAGIDAHLGRLVR